MRTPSGSIATIVSIRREVGEALVRWDATGEFADFRLSQLRPLPGSEK